MKIAPKGTVAPVLKSNAYGHGLIEVARIIEAERRSYMGWRKKEKDHIPFLIVDSFFEAVALRAAHIRTPLLVIGYTRPETIARSRLRDVSFTITSLETLKHIAEYQYSIFDFGSKWITIHLKIDTGMHRQGILPSELPEVTNLLDINPSIVLKGICSHFSDADNPDPSSTESQIHIWNKIVREMHGQYISLEHIHISNTDGHRYVSESHANLSRLGLGLYGLVDGSSFSPALDLKPVMSMETIITGIKKIQRDDTVGYGNTFKAEKDMTIATIPAGYYEGVDLRLSNNGVMSVSSDHAPCPIIGRVSMNITTIDVSHIRDVSIGMPVTVISNNPEEGNSIVNIAKRCGSIPYDIAVHVQSQLKRVVVA
jgi:alanine racemase